MESFWQRSLREHGSRQPEVDRVDRSTIRDSGSLRHHFSLLRLVGLATLLGLAATACLADGALNLSFSDSSTRYAWIQDGEPSSLPSKPVEIKGSQIQLAVPSKTAETRAFVWDKSTGALAEKKLSDVKDDTWEVKPSDFTEAAQVNISVEHDGSPVASANVDLKDSSRTQSQLLDPSTKGVLSFYAVKLGKLDATVKYRSKGAMANPVDQSFTLAAKSAEIPTFKVALPDPVETVGAAAAPAAGTTTSVPVGSSSSAPVSGASQSGGAAGAPKPGVESSPVGSFFVQIGVLAAVLIAGYFGFQYMKKNPEKVKATLEPLGVQIPKAPDDPMNAGVPAVPIQAPAPPQPVQKIMLGDSSPDPLAGQVPVAPISLGGFGGPAVATSPQLRSASGDTIPITDTPLVVGRDVGLGLSLVGETTVSRKHAEVVKQGDSVIVKDLGSTNGTFVNGARLQSEAALRPGDEVQFGAIRFRYEG